MTERAYYKAAITAFLATGDNQILGELAKRHHFALDILQRNTWLEQVANLKEELRDFQDGDVFLEFSIPRMGKRVDVVLVIRGVIFVLEYKAGAKSHDRQALDQVMDYALDLKNFHEGSHDKYVVPILISTKTGSHDNSIRWSTDHIADPMLSNGNDLAEIIGWVLSEISVHQRIDAGQWARSGYKPTPTIVEAAQALYQGHSVEEILIGAQYS